MSSAHGGHKHSSSPFGGSPFRTFFNKGSALSPKLHALLTGFEETLDERLKSLNPNNSSSDVLTLSWMRSAVDSLSRTHVDVKSLITDLEFPLTHWDDQWMMDMYLDDTVKLLDMCIALNAELSRLGHGQLFLQYALHSLADQQRVQAARRSLCDWVQQIASRSTSPPKLGDSLAVLQRLMETSSKPKASPKEKVLMQAMYGVKAQTVFVCGVLAAALSGSEAMILDMQVLDKYSWSQSFHQLQATVYSEIRRSVSRKTTYGRCCVLLREFQTAHTATEKLLALLASPSYATDDDLGTPRTETKESSGGPLTECLLELRESTDTLSVGMDGLSKQVNSFFQIVITGRDALLSNLRMPVAPGWDAAAAAK